MPDPEVGEIWDVNCDPQVGHEQGGIRPALVVSSSEFNAIPHGLRLIVPITGTNRGVRHHVKVAPPEGGLTKPSQLMCEQVKSQSLLRFRRKRGEAKPETLEHVQRLVGIFLELRTVMENGRN